MIIEINEDNYETIVQQTEKPVLLDFYLSVCKPCQFLLPTLEKLVEEFADTVVVAKMCLDDEFKFNREIGVHFGIFSVPTVIFLHHGKLVGRKGGPQKKEEYSAILSTLIKK
jgi:thioredoxin 1